MEGVSRYLTPDNLKNFVPAIKPHNAFSTIRGKVA
jgi:hypothetical protein